MKAYWLNDGKPGPDGRFCRVTDLEDGTQPIKVYGRTQEEVFGKIERTMMTAQAMVSQGRTANQPGPKAASAPPAPGRTLTLNADQQMQATADLSNPAKSPDAARRLVESATGIDLEVLAAQQFAHRAEIWQASHPELRGSKFNIKLIADNARMRCGGQLKNVTAAALETVYQELKADDYLVTEEELSARNEHEALPVQPNGNSELRTEQTGRTFATSHRGSRLGAQQTPTWKPKYTREQIDRMPASEEKRLLQAGDKDYADAVNYWYPPKARATA
jgi:hypothetical protein